MMILEIPETQQTIQELLKKDGRAEAFSVLSGDLYVNYARNALSDEALKMLFELADE